MTREPALECSRADKPPIFREVGVELLPPDMGQALSDDTCEAQTCKRRASRVVDEWALQGGDIVSQRSSVPMDTGEAETEVLTMHVSHAGHAVGGHDTRHRTSRALGGPAAAGDGNGEALIVARRNILGIIIDEARLGRRTGARVVIPDTDGPRGRVRPLLKGCRREFGGVEPGRGGEHISGVARVGRRVVLEQWVHVHLAAEVRRDGSGRVPVRGWVQESPVDLVVG
jgi:hypothetical protein